MFKLHATCISNSSIATLSHVLHPWKFMRTKLALILVWLMIAGLLVYYFINFCQLLSKSYYVDESELYKVGTFPLLNRAYEQSDQRGRARFGGSKPELVFESVDRYSFAIDRNIFQAITDKKKLEDTWMYHDLAFTVFTDKKYFDNFKNAGHPIFIRVYQIHRHTEDE